jgi:hypothetical protein
MPLTLKVHFMPTFKALRLTLTPATKISVFLLTFSLPLFPEPFHLIFFAAFFNLSDFALADINNLFKGGEAIFYFEVFSII